MDNQYIQGLPDATPTTLIEWIIFSIKDNPLIIGFIVLIFIGILTLNNIGEE